jgi:hypothetical protein
MIMKISCTSKGIMTGLKTDENYSNSNRKLCQTMQDFHKSIYIVT